MRSKGTSLRLFLKKEGSLLGLENLDKFWKFLIEQNPKILILKFLVGNFGNQKPIAIFGAPYPENENRGFFSTAIYLILKQPFQPEKYILRGREN